MVKRKSIKELKQEAIEEFKSRNGLEKYSILKVKDRREGWLLGRIRSFDYDEERDEPYASIKFQDEVGSCVLGRKWKIYQKDLDNGIAIKVNPSDVKGCVHFFTDGEPTGRYKKVFTLAGVSDREVYRFKCKFCGEVRYE